MRRHYQPFAARHDGHAASNHGDGGAKAAGRLLAGHLLQHAQALVDLGADHAIDEDLQLFPDSSSTIEVDAARAHEIGEPGEILPGLLDGRRRLQTRDAFHEAQRRPLAVPIARERDAAVILVALLRKQAWAHLLTIQTLVAHGGYVADIVERGNVVWAKAYSAFIPFTAIDIFSKHREVYAANCGTRDGRARTPAFACQHAKREGVPQ